MIHISSKDTLYMYNIYHIVKAFFPNEEIQQILKEEQESLVVLNLEEGSCFSISVEEVKGFVDRQEQKKFVTKKVYEYLSDRTGKKLAWGMLTGVRPTKLLMQRLEEGTELDDILTFLEQEYKVSEKKARLSLEIAQREKKLLSNLDQEDGFSLYVGIPFCPSICSYCSFSSSPLEKWKHEVDHYIEALCKEIHALGQGVKGKKLNTIYIGGGTPTTLEPKQLEKVLGAIEASFSYEYLQEYTIEAGRPDSITEDKLKVMREFPVTRISVNPQTMQQKTLDIIGRSHTVDDVRAIFYKARELGFDNINMDLIAGLPKEGVQEMKDTLCQIQKLQPDSLTVHALAMKRAARLGQEKKMDVHTEIEQMIEESADSARRMGLLPYYLYRQKNIAGNFENVGYAKVDKAGIYNILIMEEKQTILAAGAGASTKIVLPEKIHLDSDRMSNLIRIENVKGVTEYINRIDEMIERKEAWLWR